MVKIIGEGEIHEVDIDGLALRVFLKGLEILGGPRKLVEYRNLTWLPSLMSASYAVVLSNELMKTEDEIAQFLGLTRNTVRNMLRADPEIVMKKLEGELEAKEIKEHTAGGIAKKAYQEIKEGRDYPLMIGEYLKQIETIYEEKWQWPISVLKNIKGVDFPVNSPDILIEKLGKIIIEDKKLSEILKKLEYPVKNPAELLHKIKEKL